MLMNYFRSVILRLNLFLVYGNAGVTFLKFLD